MREILNLFADRRGASAAEYALILAIVGAGIAVAAMGLGVSISNSMNSSKDNIENCGGGC